MKHLSSKFRDDESTILVGSVFEDVLDDWEVEEEKQRSARARPRKEKNKRTVVSELIQDEVLSELVHLVEKRASLLFREMLEAPLENSAEKKKIVKEGISDGERAEKETLGAYHP